jgi:hypothetical protein
MYVLLISHMQIKRDINPSEKMTHTSTLRAFSLSRQTSTSSHTNIYTLHVYFRLYIQIERDRDRDIDRDIEISTLPNVRWVQTYT